MGAVTFSDLVIYFTIYSVLGWVCETIYCSVAAKKIVPRGFLHGPYCPIYGFGMLLILLALDPLKQYPPIVFLCAIVLSSALEYFTSWVMEKVLNTRLWDYSEKKFNLNGRICLKNSLIFGVLGIIMTYFVQPFASEIIKLIPAQYELVIGSTLIVILFIDFVITLNTMYGLNEKLKNIQLLISEFKEAEKKYSFYDKNDFDATLKCMYKLADEGKLSKALVDRFEEITKLKANSRRLIHSYPNITHSQSNETFQAFSNAVKTRSENLSGNVSGVFKRMTASFHERAQEKTYEVSFAAGVNFYKLCWIFFISSILGYILETLFCLVTNGYIESRQGMLYGPFCQVYGFGAVAMVLCLYKLAAYKDRWIFLASAVIGGVFEYICSLWQERALGTVSWEYSSHQYSIGGRTSLLYMFFWGILGVVLIKNIYPLMSRMIEKIPNRKGYFLTWLILIILSADMLLSALAVSRWRKRDDGIPPQNAVEQFMDERYPDDFMKEVYPNMIMVHK